MPYTPVHGSAAQRAIALFTHGVKPPGAELPASQVAHALSVPNKAIAALLDAAVRHGVLHKRRIGRRTHYRLGGTPEPAWPPTVPAGKPRKAKPRRGITAKPRPAGLISVRRPDMHTTLTTIFEAAHKGMPAIVIRPR